MAKAKKTTKAAIAADSDVRPFTYLDHGFKDWVSVIHARLKHCVDNGEVFVNAGTGKRVWSALIRSLPLKDRQEHQCRACRKFIMAYGGLCVLRENGMVMSALFGSVAAIPEYYAKADLAMAKAAVTKIESTVPFLTSEEVLGLAQDGDWHHFWIKTPRLCVTSNPNAERSDILNGVTAMRRVISAYSRRHVARACEMVNTQVNMHDAVGDVLGKLLRLYDIENPDALLYAAIKFPLLRHISGSIHEAFLKDVSEGNSHSSVIAAHNARTRGDKYMRPTAAPKEGTIDQAERLFESMGLALSLARRFATPDDIDAIWRRMDRQPKEGLFASVRSEGVSDPAVSSRGNQRSVSMYRFVTSILPNLVRVRVTDLNDPNVAVMTTAANPDAPRILKWENPVSWYMYTTPTPLRSFMYAGSGPSDAAPQVTLAFAAPYRWGKSLDEMWDNPDQHDSVYFRVEGAHERTSGAGLGLFPELLRHEVHGVRPVIERYSNTTQLVSVQRERQVVSIRRRGVQYRPIRLIGLDRQGVETTFDIATWS